MGGAEIRLGGEVLDARPSGALHWSARRLLVLGDLHLGRAERLAREGASLLPPYETRDTLDRLEAEVLATDPRLVVCLGDSFDDLVAANGLAAGLGPRIARLAAGRRWLWIAGNHDPAPVDLPGEHVGALAMAPIRFRHIAQPLGDGECEVSAHFHPKARLCLGGTRITRRCFLADRRRVILPAFGTYTGGLDVLDAAFRPLIGPGGQALLVGRQVRTLSLARLAS